MKHKHYEMIVAKAANMELVVLYKDNEGWFPCAESAKPYFPDFECADDYFICLPQHKEACLHWLNGGDVQLDHFDEPMPNSGVKSNCHSIDFDEDVSSLPWKLNHPFMDEAQEIRIKPKKEKRWIAVDPSTSQCTRHYSTKESCFNSEFAGCEGNASGWQFIEIEVEV